MKKKIAAIISLGKYKLVMKGSTLLVNDWILMS